jgi:hypothetical protein
MYIRMMIHLHYPRHIHQPHRHLGLVLENRVPNLWHVLGKNRLDLVDKRTMDEK